MVVLSHPTKPLAQHINEVKKATLWILERHSPESVLNSELFREWSVRLCALHDLGKGSKAFQSYIRAPKTYQDDPRKKAHTPLSLVLSTLLLEDEGSDKSIAWGVLQAVLCHHGYLRTRKELMSSLENDSFAKIIDEQLQSLSVEPLARATGECLSKLQIDDECRYEALDFLEDCEDALEQIFRENPREAIRLRLWSQFLFSVLLEADKALLAVRDAHSYQRESYTPFTLEQIEGFLESAPNHSINRLRQKARASVLNTLKERSDKKLFSLCLPTGLGKTLCAATWAFWLREHIAHQSKIIVVMPFLSVIEQTETVYRRVLQISEQGSTVMSSHSLSQRSFDSENDGSTADFFLDTWRTQLLLTTYDQFLMSLMSPRGKHQMRLHQLCDAIIIFDELQTIPCRLWRPFEALLDSLCEQGNSHVLAMSATLPEVLSDATPLLSEEETREFFHCFGRYELSLDCWNPQSLEDFTDALNECIDRGDWSEMRVLVTLNTRKSARSVRDAIEFHSGDAPCFLTADVTPFERLQLIDTLKINKPCLVVATQCIEAGVDLDFDLVIRDFAPLDSLVQIAGRCNRNNKRPRCKVQIVHLQDDESNKPFYHFVYDSIHLDATYQVLQGREVVFEEDVLELSQRYFRELERRKDNGDELLKRYVLWEEHPNIRELLRGEQSEQYAFVVLDERVQREKKLLDNLLALELNPDDFGDKWEYRRAVKHLAAELSRYTVSIYAKPGFEPLEIAERRLDMFWLLDYSYYQPGNGLLLPDLTEQYCLVI